MDNKNSKMKIGDLVRYKHFPSEAGIVIKIRIPSGGKPEVDLMLSTGEISVRLNPNAFEVIDESR